MELLLAEGAPIDAIGEHCSTPLHLAASNGHTAIVELLLTKGASAHSRNEEGNTPMHHAALNGHSDSGATPWRR